MDEEIQFARDVATLPETILDVFNQQDRDRLFALGDMGLSAYAAASTVMWDIQRRQEASIKAKDAIIKANAAIIDELENELRQYD